MTYRQKMRRVVLPQAIRVIIPPTGNEFIAMMKDTALWRSWGRPSSGRTCSAGRSCSVSADFRNLEALLVAAALLLGAHGDLHVLPAQARDPDQQGVRPQRGERRRRIEGRLEGRAGRAPARQPGRVRPGPAGARWPSGMIECPRRTTGRSRDDRAERRGRRQGRGPPQVLRASGGAEGHRHGGAQGRGRRHLRPVGVGQEHAAPLHQLPRGPDLRDHRGRRHPAGGRAPDQAASASTSASSASAPAWSSSSSTCSRT